MVESLFNTCFKNETKVDINILKNILKKYFVFYVNWVLVKSIWIFSENHQDPFMTSSTWESLQVDGKETGKDSSKNSMKQEAKIFLADTKWKW